MQGPPELRRAVRTYFHMSARTFTISDKSLSNRTPTSLLKSRPLSVNRGRKSQEKAESRKRKHMISFFFFSHLGYILVSRARHVGPMIVSFERCI